MMVYPIVYMVFIHSRCGRISSVNSISYHFLCFISFTNCSIETQPLDFHMLTPSEKKIIQNPRAGVSRLEGLVVSIGVRILRTPASHGGQKHGNFTFAVGPSVT